MANMRHSATNERIYTGTRERQSIAPDRIEGGWTVISRLAGILARAFLVVLLIATPSVLLVNTTPDTTQIVVLVAILAAVFTMVEYNSTYPSLVEFRDAPPFNRIRFLSLFTTVFVLTVIARGKDAPTTITLFFNALGSRIGELIDFPYSPVRLVVLMMPSDVDDALIESVRTAAGLSYLVSILSLAIFVLILRGKGWPRQLGGFNVWINLPTFDPTAGGDVVDRLKRDGHVNLILGFLLPFIIPAFVKLAADMFNPVSLANDHTLIWTMTAWAFLPASLIMRGIAMMRVAQMIVDQRARAYAVSKFAGALPA